MILVIIIIIIIGVPYRTGKLPARENSEVVRLVGVSVLISSCLAFSRLDIVVMLFKQERKRGESSGPCVIVSASGNDRWHQYQIADFLAVLGLRSNCGNKGWLETLPAFLFC